MIAHLRYALLITLCLGCEGVGLPLVDSVAGETVSPRAGCEKVLFCPPTVRALAVPSAAAVLLPPQCAASPVQRLDLAQLAARANCRCERLEVQLDGASSEGAVHGFTAADCSITLRASAPAALRFTGFSGHNLDLQLEGQVDLAISARSTLQTAAIAAATPDAGSRLSVEDTVASHLTVHGLDVDLTRTALHQSRLSARALRMESVTLADCTLDSTTLLAVDATLDTVALSTVDGSLSAGRAEGLRLDSCDTLLIAGSEIAQSQLGACTTVMRLYGSTVESSLVNGTVELDGSSVSDTMFGVGAAATLIVWGSDISDAALCRGADVLRLGSGSIRCSLCEGTLDTPAGDVCLADEADNFSLGQNSCASLEAAHTCESAFPRRERP